METTKIFSCKYCTYTSNRKFNLNSHEINKHSKEILNETNNEHLEENVPLIDNFVPLNDKKINYCSKCSKEYLTIKSLKKHEEKCIGINILTCPKCMLSFTTRQHKSDHIKRNNCKAKSIVHAIQPEIIINGTNVTVNNNTNTNTYNNTINNNNTFIINNYGSERLDYLSNEDMYKILTSTNSIPLYIEQKHFNKDFPENHNIMYDDKSKRCKIKENNKWKTINLSLISTKLINDNSNSLLVYFNKNKEELNEKIHNEELYYFILNKLLLIKNKNDKEKYNTLYNLIKFIIENNTFTPQTNL